jgi:hypothetical protein
MISGTWDWETAMSVEVGLFEACSYLRDHHGGSLVAALAGSLVLAGAARTTPGLHWGSSAGLRQGRAGR